MGNANLEGMQEPDVSYEQIWGTYHRATAGAKQAAIAAAAATDPAAKAEAQEAEAQLRELARSQLDQIYKKYPQFGGVSQNPTDGMSGVAKLSAATTGLIKDNLLKVGNLIPGSQINEADITANQQQLKPLMKTGPGMFADILANTLTSIPEVSGTTAALSRVGKVGNFIANHPTLRGMFEGVLQNEINANPGDNRWMAAATGAGFGGALPAVGNAVTSTVRGLPRTPDAQLLLDKGVSLTPGKLRPGGALDKMEQLPIFKWLGMGPEDSLAGAKHDFAHALVQEAAPPGVTITKGDMPSMLRQAYDGDGGAAGHTGFAGAYDQAKGFPLRTNASKSPVIFNVNAPDEPLQRALAQVQNSSTTAITGKGARAATGNFLEDLYTSTLPKNRPWRSDDLIAMRSKIRAARRQLGSNDPYAAGKGELLDKAEQKVTDALSSQLPPDAMTALQMADGQYRKYMTVEDAALRSGFKDPSIASIASAVKGASGKTVSGKRNFALRRGNDPMRDLAEAGSRVFTEDPLMRTGASNLPSALVAGTIAQHPAAGIPASFAALLASNTKAGRNFASGQTGWQRGTQDWLSRVNPTLAPLLKQALQLGERPAVALGDRAVGIQQLPQEKQEQ